MSRAPVGVSVMPLENRREALVGVATGARPLKLNLAPAAELPIFLAALTDESVRLAGELADGWLPFLYPRRCLEEGRALLREGAARAGDAEPRLPIYPTAPPGVADAPAEARGGGAGLGPRGPRCGYKRGAAMKARSAWGRARRR